MGYKHEMPVLTHARRDELVEWLEEGVACSDEYGFSGNVLKSMQIALAALTAEPVKTKLKYSSALPKFIGDTNEVESVHCWVHGDTPEFATNEEAYAEAQKMTGDLYTAPPAPVLKPIELNGDDIDTPIDWYAGAKTRDMVIDVIRAAGYEVKE